MSALECRLALRIRLRDIGIVLAAGGIDADGFHCAFEHASFLKWISCELQSHRSMLGDKADVFVLELDLGEQRFIVRHQV